MVDQPPSPTPAPPRRPRGALLVAFVFLGIAVAAAVGLLLAPQEAPPPAVVPPPPPPPAAMTPVPLDKLPAVPTDQAALAAAEALVRERTSPSLAVGVDGDAAAWLRALAEADARAPLIPQRLGPADLQPGGAPVGTEAMLVARLDDRAPAGADDGWQWLLLHLGKDQYAVALAPPASRDLVIGRDARVLGRFVGRAPLPSEHGEQATPLIAARVALPADDVVGTSTDDPLAEFHVARFSMPDDVFADVSDERPLVETRPYYYLLGQAKLDLTSAGVYDDALDANRDGSRVHDDPPPWRGKPMRVTGTVINVWKDEQASADRPFEVTDVWRVQLISTDNGPVTESTATGEKRTSIKLVSRLYEVAIAMPEAPPKEGQRITATGRFLKWRAMPAEVDLRRDSKNGVHRESDRIYALMIVAPEWKPAPPKPSGPRAAPAWVLWATLAVASVAAALVLWSWRRDDAQARAARPRRRAMRPDRRPPAG